MKSRARTPFILAATSLLLAACDSPAEPGGSEVEVSPAARAFIEQILTGASAAAWFNARFSDGIAPPHLAFSGWLVGGPPAYRAHVSLATTDDGTYDEFCSGDLPGGGEEEGFWLEHDACSRLRIDGGVYSVDLYFTERPHRLPDDRHELSYRSTVGPAGTVTYPENPLTTWRYDFDDDGSHEIEADIDARLRFLPDTGPEGVLDHSGTVRGGIDASGEVVMTELALSFPGATTCAVPLRAEVTDDGTSISGQVRCGNAVVARITHPQDEFVFEWVPP